MLALPLLSSHAPPVRVMALHALAYCPRLFYREEVEEIRVADAAGFAGRQLHAALEADEDGEAVNLELANSALGLVGKVDCLRRRDGSYLPYEHKRGQPRRNAGHPPEAWPSDRVQVTAYALLLEEAFGQPVPEGRVRYHAANVTVRVPIDEAARADLMAALAEARRLRQSVERPPIADNERLCARCSLAPVWNMPRYLDLRRGSGRRGAVRTAPLSDGRMMPESRLTKVHGNNDLGGGRCRLQ